MDANNCFNVPDLAVSEYYGWAALNLSYSYYVLLHVRVLGLSWGQGQGHGLTVVMIADTWRLPSRRLPPCPRNTHMHMHMYMCMYMYAGQERSSQCKVSL